VLIAAAGLPPSLTVSACVRLGRDIADEEEVLTQTEHRLRGLRLKSEAATSDLLLLLPAGVSTARLGFALTASATGSAVLDSLVLSRL
jgi:hypothetical protein